MEVGKPSSCYFQRKEGYYKPLKKIPLPSLLRLIIGNSSYYHWGMLSLGNELKGVRWLKAGKPVLCGFLLGRDTRLKKVNRLWLLQILII